MLIRLVNYFYITYASINLGLTGFERFTLKLNGGDLKVGQYLKVVADNGK